MPNETTAEQSYLFRHALVRDAAYELQLPAERERLHGLAFEVMEAAVGGRPPDLPLMKISEAVQLHPSDARAADLAEHARLGGIGDEARRLYLKRAGFFADREYRVADALGYWLEFAELVVGEERAQANYLGARLCFLQGDTQEALRLLSLALDESSSLRMRGRVLGSIALTLHATGRRADAEARYLEAMQLLDSDGDARSRGVVLGNLADLYRISGRMQEAEQALETALKLGREAANRRSECIVTSVLAQLYQHTGRHAEAEQAYGRAHNMSQQLEDRRLEGEILANRALLCEEIGRLEEARAWYDQALDIHREVGNRRSLAVTLGNLGTRVFHDGDARTGLCLLAEALELHRELSNRLFEGGVLGNMATIHRRLGEFSLAEREFKEALDILRPLGPSRFLGAHLCEYAVLEALQGQSGAVDAWREGIEIIRGFADSRLLEVTIAGMREACTAADLPMLGEGEE